MKKKVYGIIFLVILIIGVYITYYSLNKYKNKNSYNNYDIKNLYLNKNNNENKVIPVQKDQ